MTGTTVISGYLLTWCLGVALGAAYDYSPAKQEETEVEIQKVEVYEVPWIGDQQSQNGYGPPKQQYGPPSQSYNPEPQSPPEQAYGPPAQEYGPPAQEYGTPAQEYGPPSQEYGPPALTTTEYTDLTTTLSSNLNTTNTNSSNNSTQNQTARLEKINGASEGQYYIYHPNGLLQKVIYLTKDDSKNMAFSAQLKYKNVDPIRGPIYTYDPDTYAFYRLNRK